MFNQRRQAAAPRVHPNSSTGDDRLKRRGHGSLNAELFKKLYFSTSSRQALPDHHTDTAALALSVAPSMKTLQVGMGYVKSQAPPPMRSHCTYADQYQTLPLDDVAVTKEMRNLIASTSREGSSTNKVIEGLKLGSNTTCKAFYGEYGDKLYAVPVEQQIRPEGYIRVSNNAKFMESKTVFQRDYPLYSEDRQQKGRPNACEKGHDKMHHLKGRFDDNTSYKREFGKDGPSQNRYPGATKSQSMGELMTAAKARQVAAFSGRNPPRH